MIIQIIVLDNFISDLGLLIGAVSINYSYNPAEKLESLGETEFSSEYLARDKSRAIIIDTSFRCTITDETSDR